MLKSDKKMSSVGKNRQLSRTLKDIASTRGEIIGTAQGMPNPATDVTPLIGKEDQTSLGSKLINAGIVIAVGIPEPIVSDITGAALIATGYTMNRLTSHVTIRDIYTNVSKTTKDIAQLRRELTTISL